MMNRGAVDIEKWIYDCAIALASHLKQPETLES